MTNPLIQRGVYSREEIDQFIEKSDIVFEKYYFKLRAKAIIGLFITGKRRFEVASVEIDNIKIEDGYLYILFLVVKKRKKKIQPMRPKRFPLTSVYAQHILNYFEWMKKNHPECKYLFPSIRSVFGETLAFNENKHLSGRQVLRIIKKLVPSGWCHLFRDTRAAEIVKADEREHGEAKLMTVYKVKHALNLERETTAWNYINRYATETVDEMEDY